MNKLATMFLMSLTLASCTTNNSGLPHSSSTSSTPEFKTVTVNTFLAGAVSEQIDVPLKISIPDYYVRADAGNTAGHNAYWMRQEDVSDAIETGDLPRKNGYMSGKVSLNVGYDLKNGAFIGADDMRESAKQYGLEVRQFEEREVSGFPIIFAQLEQEALRKTSYSIWIATLYDSNVLHLVYAAPPDIFGRDDAVWNKLIDSLLSN